MPLTWVQARVTHQGTAPESTLTTSEALDDKGECTTFGAVKESRGGCRAAAHEKSETGSADSARGRSVSMQAEAPSWHDVRLLSNHHCFFITFEF